MDIKAFLKDITAVPGAPGHEGQAALAIQARFDALGAKTRLTPLSSVVAEAGSGRVRAMVCAHEDEVCMVVTKIESDGSLRLRRVGGVDPRILPSSEIIVKAKSGDLYGVVGAKPPHVLTNAERKKAVTFDTLSADIGYPYEQAVKLVRVGDIAVFKPCFTELKNNLIAGKTLDDRACVASMLVACEEMKKLNSDATTYYVASAQEETSGRGALTAAFDIAPDFAVILDVTFAASPYARDDVLDINKIAIAKGANIHPALYKRLAECARAHRFEFEIEPLPADTGTDAWDVETARGGIPTILISIPTRYMHTTVETLSVDVIENTGKLVAEFIADVSRDWEAIEWY